MFIETRHENYFQYLLEGLSETSDNQALPLYHNIKMKAYTRVVGVAGGGDTLPWDRLSSVPQANIDYVHMDEIGEIVSSIFLKGGKGGYFTLGWTVPTYRR